MRIKPIFIFAVCLCSLLYASETAAGEETFVTKVRLIQVNKAEKRGICDILPDWQQLPVEQGDVVFF